MSRTFVSAVLTAVSISVAQAWANPAALTGEGLYEDEADAMLATWQLSYFDSEGMRVFFVLPQRWTDAQLPLWTSIPGNITRAMLGRVELISLGRFRDALLAHELRSTSDKERRTRLKLVIAGFSSCVPESASH